MMREKKRVGEGERERRKNDFFSNLPTAFFAIFLVYFCFCSQLSEFFLFAFMKGE